VQVPLWVPVWVQEPLWVPVGVQVPPWVLVWVKVQQQQVQVPAQAQVQALALPWRPQTLPPQRPGLAGMGCHQKRKEDHRMVQMWVWTRVQL
jgi:hypothetical protein